MTATIPRKKEIPYFDPTSIDFALLAERDPAFAPFHADAQRTRFLDFQDPALLHQLTRTLLSVHFGGLVLPSLPDSRLCPPVPVRWNYVRWIQDLLDSSSPTTDAEGEGGGPREVRGVDVGTGATAIYALLACGTHADWRVVGTEVDALSAASARVNLDANVARLQGRARVVEVSGERLMPLGKLGFGVEGEGGGGGDGDGGGVVVVVDFVMTNPPFYHSAEDMRASYVGKDAAPSAVCTGSENEMICPGGDVGFVTRLLEESLELREKVRWYSAMMGKLSSLQEMVARLKKAGVTNWAVCSLQAGKRTKRWAVAWSFLDHRPSNEIARMGELVHAVLPPANAQTIRSEGMEGREVGEKVDEVLRGLDVVWRWRAARLQGVMLAKENVWSRAARRRKRFNDSNDDNDEKMDLSHEDEKDEGIVALAVRITCKDGEVDVRWLRGLDQLLFASFCGMLKRTFIGHG